MNKIAIITCISCGSVAGSVVGLLESVNTVDGNGIPENLPIL